MYDHSFRLEKPDEDEGKFVNHLYGWADLEPKPMSQAAKRRAHYTAGALKLWLKRDQLIEDWLDGKTDILDRALLAEYEAAAEILQRLADDELQIVIIKCHAVSAPADIEFIQI